MNFQIKNTTCDENSLNPIYNAIQLNSSNIGDLTDAQEGDVLTYDGDKWIYSSIVTDSNNIIFLSSATTGGQYLPRHPDFLEYNFEDVVFKIGQDINRTLQGKIIINNSGTYQIDLNIVYWKSAEDNIASVVQTFLKKTDIEGNSTILPYSISSVTSLDLATSARPVESSINYVNNFILGDEISVCGNIRYGTLYVNIYGSAQPRLIVKRIA
jgi:hypothetical protein